MFREGCIAYLKQYEDVEDRILRSYYLNRGAFNHPVLVLQIQSDTTELLVCLLTSFGNRSLKDRYGRSRYNEYMAIYPQPTPTASFPQLRLVNDHQLRKPGYVNVRQSHLVHHSMLEHYDRLFPEYFRLTDESFAIVAKRFEIEPVAAKLQRLALEVEQLQSQLEACETRHGPSQPVQQTTILTRPTENGIKEFQPSRKPPKRPVNKAPLQILVLVALLGAVWTFRQNSLREIIDSCNGGFAAILRLVGSALKCMTNGLISTIGLLLRDDDGMIQAML